MIYKGGIGVHQRWTAWMNIENPTITVAEAVQKLKDLGNEILEVDEVNRRIKVMDVSSDEGGMI